jgi:hypothetical protein
MVPNHQPVYHVSYSSQKRNIWLVESTFFLTRFETPLEHVVAKPHLSCCQPLHQTHIHKAWDIPSEIVPCGIVVIVDNVDIYGPKICCKY